jgi:uncharacterized protein YoxC
MGEEKKEHGAEIQKEDYVLQLETELHELEKREESSTRRMQLLVYPSMVAFIILAAYGFYLVNSLTKDVHRMADSVFDMSHSVQTHMDIISQNTTKMSEQMKVLVDNTRDMNGNMTELVATTGKMSTSVDHLSAYTGNMQQDMWSLNRSISKPLNMFNKFIPWGNNSGSSQYRPPVYYPQYQRSQQQQTKIMPTQVAPSSSMASDIAPSTTSN